MITRVTADCTASQLMDLPGQQEFLMDFPLFPPRNFLLKRVTPLQLLWGWQLSKFPSHGALLCTWVDSLLHLIHSCTLLCSRVILVGSHLCFSGRQAAASHLDNASNSAPVFAMLIANPAEGHLLSAHCQSLL